VPEPHTLCHNKTTALNNTLRTVGAERTKLFILPSATGAAREARKLRNDPLCPSHILLPGERRATTPLEHWWPTVAPSGTYPVAPLVCDLIRGVGIWNG